MKNTEGGVQSNLSLLSQGDISQYLETILVVRATVYLPRASDSQKPRILLSLYTRIHTYILFGWKSP